MLRCQFQKAAPQKTPQPSTWHAFFFHLAQGPFGRYSIGDRTCQCSHVHGFMSMSATPKCFTANVSQHHFGTSTLYVYIPLGVPTFSPPSIGHGQAQCGSDHSCLLGSVQVETTVPNHPQVMLGQVSLLLLLSGHS